MSSLLENWLEEKRSAYLYRIIAENETSPIRKKLFHDLAKAANKQAGIWESKIKHSGKSVPKTFKPSIRTRLVGKMIPILGPKPIRLILSAMKVRGMSVYLNIDPAYPFSVTNIHHEHRHRGLNSANSLRAAVFGVNDGLISNMSLLLGVAGATSNHHFIILSGIAGLIAGASSMASGEYISVRSQREFYEYQIDLERHELEEYPEEEAAELAVIYQARGLPKIESDKLARFLISQPEKALDALAREELGLNPKELGSPWSAAVSSFIAFSFGALIPLIPFLCGIYRWNWMISIALTAVTLFSIGATLSLFTNRSALKSGIRMLIIGTLSGAATYMIGSILHVGLHL